MMKKNLQLILQENNRTLAKKLKVTTIIRNWEIVNKLCEFANEKN